MNPNKVFFSTETMATTIAEEGLKGNKKGRPSMYIIWASAKRTSLAVSVLVVAGFLFATFLVLDAHYKFVSNNRVSCAATE